MNGKIRRRLELLDDCIDALLRTDCRFVPCPGPLAPVREGFTCFRCYCIHRAVKQGLIKITGQTPQFREKWEQVPAIATIKEPK
jgi:hypothetical protein